MTEQPCEPRNLVEGQQKGLMEMMMIVCVLIQGTVVQTMTVALSVVASRSNHLGNQMKISLNRTFAFGDFLASRWPGKGYHLVKYPYCEKADPFARVISLTSLSAVNQVMKMIHSLHQIGDVVDPKEEHGFPHCWGLSQNC